MSSNVAGCWVIPEPGMEVYSWENHGTKRGGFPFDFSGGYNFALGGSR